MPNKVLASRFNTLKARVDKLLGPATETNSSSADYRFGYGEAIGDNVAQSSSNDLIDALAYKKLYMNIQKVRYHQVGTAAFTAEAYKVGDYLSNLANTDKVEEAYTIGLETLATNMETDKLLLHSTQAEITVCDAAESQYNSWNGSINHIFTVTFTSAQARREYFNAGGKIRFQPSMSYSGSQAKTLDWKNMLASIGSVDFGCVGTYSSNGFGQEYGGIGHEIMTSSYQTAYFAQGGGVYNPNQYRIYAMELSDSVLQFKCEFNDPSYGQPDENVLADVRNDTFFVRANGTAQIDGTQTVTVSVPQPTSSTISGL